MGSGPVTRAAFSDGLELGGDTMNISVETIAGC